MEYYEDTKGKKKTFVYERHIHLYTWLKFPQSGVEGKFEKSGDVSTTIFFSFFFKLSVLK